jgi:hypothetical protein
MRQHQHSSLDNQARILDETGYSYTRMSENRIMKYIELSTLKFFLSVKQWME